MIHHVTERVLWSRTLLATLMLLLCGLAGYAQCVNPGTPINFSTTGNNTGPGYTTVYVLTDNGGTIQQTVASGFAAPAANGYYKIYAVNYNTTVAAPTLTAGTNVTAIGGNCASISSTPITFCVVSGIVTAGSSITFANSGNNTATDYTTVYALTDASGAIISTSTSTSAIAPKTGGCSFSIYAVNYSTSGTAPTLTPGTSISAIGGDCSAISSTPISFTVVPATPTAAGTNPTIPNTANGSISLTGTGTNGSYPANTPVSVTYTTPGGSTATYTGNTDANGAITIPNLAAGTYGPFTVSVNGCTPSTPGGSATLVDPVPPAPTVTANNPPTAGTNGSITVSSSTSTPYPPNTPISVTYTTPNGTSVFTGTTDGSGTVTIPNLPTGTYGPFAVSVNGGAPSTPAGSVTLTSPAPPTPTVSGGNPTTPGTSTGSIVVMSSSTPYAPNTPVSVTYTTPGGGTSVFTGTTDGSGNVTIPNLPAGTYGPFTVSVNNSPPSTAGGTVTLTDPTPDTPVATTLSNPTSAGTATGVITLTGSTAYPASTPVSVTYTTPTGTATFTGSTNTSGQITIPNLPAGTYGPFAVSINGGTPSTPGGSATLTDPAPSAPVFTVSNPTSAGTPTGSVSLTGTTAYPANTPVSVTYTTPGGGTATFTGTTDGTGAVTIPNLPAGTYGPFSISLNGGTPSTPDGSATLTDPAPSTPVASMVSNPVSAGGSTGVVSLTGTGGAYPPNVPVSVTYTTPGGGTATFTGTTNNNGQVIIPNLPAGTYGPFTVSINGSTPSTAGGTVTLTDPSASTPVASVGSNPTTAGGSTGVVSLTGTTAYPANTPVSVTYTTPTGTAVFTGTTDGTGTITIPNLPAGTYGPFTVSLNGGAPSTAGGSVTLTDPSASTPVASVVSNPSSVGTSTGVVSLTGTTAYTANTPVSVTYTTPNGPATFTGNTNGSGQVIIPNLPTGTYGPFIVSLNGGTPSTAGGSVTLTDPAPSSPVATLVSNPTTAGGSTGVVSLTGTTAYPANTPVSVTYTTPTGPAVFTGTTDGTGTITIPNLPAGTYGPFAVSINGSPASTAGGSVTLRDPAASTPVASVVSNPTTAGGSTGVVSLTGTTAYPANTPVSVTYTTPTGPAVFTGSTNSSGQVIIPNLPTGTYGPFIVSLNGGTPSTAGGSVTLRDPSDLTPIVYARPSSAHGTSTISVVVDLLELNNVATSGLITVKISREDVVSLSLPAGATTVNSRPVQNSVWSFDDSSDPDYYILTTNASVAASGQLSFGLTGTLTPGSTAGKVTLSASVVGGSGGENKITNNADADTIDYFQN